VGSRPFARSKKGLAAVLAAEPASSRYRLGHEKRIL
jgi:hypothetical protein